MPNITYCFQPEYESASFMVYVRTMQELRAPLDDVGSSVYKMGMRLVSIQFYEMPTTYIECSGMLLLIEQITYQTNINNSFY